MSKPSEPSSDAGQPGPDDTRVPAQQDGALGSFGVPPEDPLGTRADVTPYAEGPPGGVPAPAAKRTPAQAMAAAAAESTAMLGTPSSQPPRAPGGAPAAQPVAPMVPSSQATPQTRRRGLIPRWVPWAAGGTALGILLIVLVTLLVVRGNIVRVPSVQGLTSKAAQTRLQEAGLKMVVSDELFSATVAAGSVVSQQPRPGTTLNAGTAVQVALSAGSETFSMPDVLGLQLGTAQSKLAAKGLSVVVETAPSEQDQGTVIATDPSAGSDVQTGSSVRVTVAAGTNATQTVLPAKLTGHTFVIDPAPMPVGSASDPVMDVARRLRALLEASGAHVVVTRDVTDQGTAANTLARAQRAKATPSDALIGLEVLPSGAGGLQVLTMPTTSVAQFPKSDTLAQALVASLKGDFPSIVSQPTAPGSDTILTDTGVPGARLDLGSTSSSSDELSFTDPQWADNVAQGAYRAIAQVFGVR